MKTLLSAVSVLAMTAFVASPAFAQGGGDRWPKWYIGVSGGLSFLEDSDIKSGAAGAGDISFDTSARVNGAIGYMPYFGGNGFMNNFRMEAEVGYQWAGVDSAQFAAIPGTASNDLRILSYMGNLYYDFRNASTVTPYVGAGAGGAQVKFRDDLGTPSDRTDNVFAYQFMAGLSVAPVSIPYTEWSLGYRYFAAQDPSFSGGGIGFKLDDVTSHNVEVGARFRF